MENTVKTIATLAQIRKIIKTAEHRADMNRHMNMKLQVLGDLIKATKEFDNFYQMGGEFLLVSKKGSEYFFTV